MKARKEENIKIVIEDLTREEFDMLYTVMANANPRAVRSYIEDVGGAWCLRKSGECSKFLNKIADRLGGC